MDCTFELARSIFRVRLAHFLRGVFYLSLIFVVQTAQSAQYTALVVGAESYRDQSLQTPANNARSVAEKLAALGFEVDVSVDQTYYELRETVRIFEEKAARATFSIVYFSGHTIKLGGNQYLIPVDVDLRSRADIRKLIDVQQLLDKLRAPNTVLLILDGCAETQFARGWGEVFERSAVCAKEASQLQLNTNTTLVVTRSVAGSATLGAVAGPLNLYADTFLEKIDSNASITDVLRDISDIVETRSGGLQVPQVIGNEQQTASFRIPKNNRKDQLAGADSSEPGATSALSSGVYRIENLRHSQMLAEGRSGELTLAPSSVTDIATEWLLTPGSSEGFALRNRQSGNFLAMDGDSSGLVLVPDQNERSTSWQVSAVEFGSPGESMIAVVGDSSVLRVQSNAVILTNNQSASATGWVFRRTGDLYDMDVAVTADSESEDTTTGVESSPASAPLATADPIVSTAVDTSAAADDDQNVSNNNRVIAETVFEQFRTSLQEKRLNEITQLMRPGDSLDAFVHLVTGYDELGVELSDVRLDRLTDVFHADLTVQLLQFGQQSLEPTDALRKARLVVRPTGTGQSSTILASHCRPDCDTAETIVESVEVSR